MPVYMRVKEYIKKKGIKQTELARMANIPVPTLNAMLNGRHKMYTDDFCAICYALNTVPEEFIT